jgi:hypothetical protein
VVCLHTDASSPGALDFWRAYPAAVEVFDARPDPWDTVHFELDAAHLPTTARSDSPVTTPLIPLDDCGPDDPSMTSRNT